ncbi:MAG TPA: thrombospondin type 3 repeat-containing protein [bacterium]|nr:thrombospondin type 3 repeat-containing protein [bacterium]
MKKFVVFLVLSITFIYFSSCSSAKKTNNDGINEDTDNIADSEDINLVEEQNEFEDFEEIVDIEEVEDSEAYPYIDEESDSDYDFPDYSNKDSDNDGLSDWEEVEIGTDPFNFDTDGDGTDDGTEIYINTDPLDSSDPSDGVIYVYIVEGSYKMIKLSMISGIDDITPEQDYTVKNITLKTDKDYGCQYYENYYNLMPGFETVSAFPENGIDSMDETIFYSVQKSTEITFLAVMAFSFCEYEYEHETAYDEYGVMVRINFVSGDNILKSQPVFVILKALE